MFMFASRRRFSACKTTENPYEYFPPKFLPHFAQRQNHFLFPLLSDEFPTCDGVVRHKRTLYRENQYKYYLGALITSIYGITSISATYVNRFPSIWTATQRKTHFILFVLQKFLNHHIAVRLLVKVSLRANSALTSGKATLLCKCQGRYHDSCPWHLQDKSPLFELKITWKFPDLIG